MSWFNCIKEQGSTTFGSHGSNPLMSAESPAIRSRKKKEMEKWVYALLGGDDDAQEEN